MADVYLNALTPAATPVLGSDTLPVSRDGTDLTVATVGQLLQALALATSNGLTGSISLVGSTPTLTLTTTDGAPPTTIASAATVAIGGATTDNITISGTTTITAFDTVAAGIRRFVTFSGALTLNYNATSLILPNAANITTAPGDTAVMVSLGSGNWSCVAYQHAAAAASRAAISAAQSGTNADITSLSAGVLAPGLLGSSNNAVTAAGSTQGTATAITTDVSVITSAAAGTGVIMPMAVGGKCAVVVNRAANAILVYPASGHYFDGYSANAPLTIAPNSYLEMYGANASSWFTTLQAAAVTSALVGTVAVSQGGTGLTASPANGQLLIGNGAGFTLATLSPGSNVSITNTAGVITINANAISNVGAEAMAIINFMS